MATDLPIDVRLELDKLRGDFGQLESSLKSIATIGKLAFSGWVAHEVMDGVRSVTSLLADSVQQATEAARAQTKLEAVLKATGQAAGLNATEMKGLAKSLMDVTDIDDDVILNAEAILATFKEIKGDNFKEATKAALDMSAVLGGDLQGAALQVGKALNDPTEGLTALKRAGVSFTEQQKEVIKKLQATGDLAGAQKVILAELKAEFGGAGEAMANAAGHGLGRFALMIDNVKEDLGGKLLPTLDKFLDTLGAKLKPVLDQVVDSFGNWTGNLGDSEINSFADAVVNLTKTFGEMATALTGMLPLFQTLLDKVRETIDAALGVDSNMKGKFDKQLNSMSDADFQKFAKGWADAKQEGSTFAGTGTQLRWLSKNVTDFHNDDPDHPLGSSIGALERSIQDRTARITNKIAAQHHAEGLDDGSGILGAFAPDSWRRAAISAQARTDKGLTNPSGGWGDWWNSVSGAAMNSWNASMANRPVSPAGFNPFGGPAGFLAGAGMQLAMSSQLGVVGPMLGAGLDEQMIRQAVQADIAMKKDKGFQATITDAEGYYQQVSKAAASKPPAEEKQITLTERLVKLAEEKKQEDAETKRVLEQIRDKKGAAILG